MALNIGNKLELDFSILLEDSCKYLTILDHSSYIEVPDSPVMDVCIPGGNTIRIPYNPSDLTIINCNLLGLSSVTSTSSLPSLPDGVYTLTYRICPLNILYITKKIIRTCVIECKYLNLYAKFSIDCSFDNEDFIKKLDKIKNYIESAKAHASICNYLKAAEFIQKANNLLLEVDCHC